VTIEGGEKPASEPVTIQQRRVFQGQIPQIGFREEARDLIGVQTQAKQQGRNEKLGHMKPDEWQFRRHFGSDHLDEVQMAGALTRCSERSHVVMFGGIPDFRITRKQERWGDDCKICTLQLLDKTRAGFCRTM
jgi:hypothetical protein